MQRRSRRNSEEEKAAAAPLASKDNGIPPSSGKAGANRRSRVPTQVDPGDEDFVATQADHVSLVGIAPRLEAAAAAVASKKKRASSAGAKGKGGKHVDPAAEHDLLLKRNEAFVQTQLANLGLPLRPKEKDVGTLLHIN
jgi:hypothetical protein